ARQSAKQIRLRRNVVIPSTSDIKSGVSSQSPSQPGCAGRLFVEEEMRRVIDLVNERQTLVRRDARIIRSPKPRNLAAQPRHLASSRRRFTVSQLSITLTNLPSDILTKQRT